VDSPSREHDTIAAIATAYGQGAIGVVRVSGNDAMGVIEKIFKTVGSAHTRKPLKRLDPNFNLKPRECAVSGQSFEGVRGNFSKSFPEKGFSLESHRMYYGEIYNGGELVDEVMVCAMLAPRSFTREDTVEIYAHGGMLVVQEVLGAVLAAGARQAEPGEFTKRAFLNGRINLSQAEAVMDLISAKSGEAKRVALRQLGGGLSRRLEAVRDKILLWLAHIELSIDYPEHEDEARNAAEILAEGGEVIAEIRGLLETANTGRIIREGVRTAIVGRPNVGKSTLLNAILHENRAIVHETAGTTRDVLTESVRVADVPLVIMDTAGLRETTDPIEKIGIEKTLEAAADAELILFVADNTVGLTFDDLVLLEQFEKNVIVLMNKCDKTVGLQPTPETLSISALTGDGLDKLYAAVREMFLGGSVGAGAEADIITRERHKGLLSQALAHVETAMREINAGVPEDLISVPLRAAYIALGEVLGVEIKDDIVDKIFEEFCLGK
jgi:tRNA modification GTPase